MYKKIPILESERVRLRQFVDSDLEHVFRGLSHPNIIKYYGISLDIYSKIASTYNVLAQRKIESLLLFIALLAIY